ncbi:MAG: LysR family transcriptional regulator [Myxococcales bacterium]|nr:LysR family transcriptional regulator [Myxococcales bacterium]
MALDDMMLFERVVDLRSFTEAARQLGVSKATVSTRVAKLEARLGVRLLHRTTRSVQPTDLGVAYAERCRTILAEVREADASVSALAPEPHGVLRISCPRLFGIAFLTPLVTRWLADHPHVQLELALTERRVDLVEEGFDLAIRIGALSDSGLVARRLGQAGSVVVGCPAVCPSPLERLTWIGVGRRSVEIVVDGRAVELCARVAVDSLEMARDLAIAGTGVALLPRFVCLEALNTGALVELWPAEQLPRWPIHAVFPTRRQLSARVRTFLDLLVQLAVAAPWDPSRASSSEA